VAHNNGVRSVEEHQKIVAALLNRPEAATVPLAAALGRALANDHRAPISLPGFDNSAMDGYAVRAQDIVDASPENAIQLIVAADIPAGRTAALTLEAGQAHRIMTGAPMPAGSDTVVQVEATDGGTQTVAIHESRQSGAHVRYAGEDLRAGDLALNAGAALGPSQIGLLAALGCAQVDVIPPLHVLVLSTGTELAAPGTVLEPGQIYESNAIMLASAIVEAGGTAHQLRFVSDDVDDFHASLDPYLDEADLIITSGGVSAGAYEVVKDAFTGQGVEFAKVAMQPGLPQGAGRYRGVPVVTLPGNPVSALVSFEVFIRPAMRAAMGFAKPLRARVRAAVDEDLTAPEGKRQFRRGTLDRATGIVTTIGPPGSHFLRSLAVSDCLLDIAEDVTRVAKGTIVDVWDLS
jgi:molybdopterin molybdotransferase